MEHRSVTAVEMDRAASANLVGTYFRLGDATPGSKSWREEGFRVCTGKLEHPICNFAADLDLGPESARRLLEIALKQRCFNVYTLPGDKPRNAPAILENAGFRMSHHLVQMAAEPLERGSYAELVCAEDSRERARVARFMVDQFFGRQSQLFRKRAAETTCAALDLPLYTLEGRNGTIGAVMLSEAGSVLGVYNLCVAYSQRGRGWGTELIRSVLDIGAQRGQAVVLQCEEHLKEWYLRRGFVQIGSVGILNLPKPQALAIMDQS